MFISKDGEINTEKGRCRHAPLYELVAVFGPRRRKLRRTDEVTEMAAKAVFLCPSWPDRAGTQWLRRGCRLCGESNKASGHL
ncbi:hypothetical protein [Parageobacillus thermoglucosidasius]|uniref:Uncharacterized protein n=1 Tax=Parageobacillus thermoglucosidasius TaxID=1426 RepID=A0AAN0YP17_PARTM|nr:hypothetical protein [Parageobacillus thermoglucosidasius]ALF09868.1 hypothetical protein AOT13_07550 [Parageobacillus thermoglucosidasius]ANZ29949.1 hypothetical protein BCV53_07555 [Parageobacillus thermoglucosidasius]APM80687.1 hypothetical protein BCV54_07560 [Parageobacillus thermoglucosidasius]KJX70308.1 hypothetical protein WH82_01495 [Parageobacillus thermoglucosidasius]RDE21272.1 hypothetical protein DV712_14135 [Parageobacillus thermoglucosidasius]